MNTAFVILKPDCIARGLVGKVLSRFESKRFDIIKLRVVLKTYEWARRHYGHLTPDILELNSNFMAESRLIGVVLSGTVTIVEQLKKMVGATDSAFAAPGTIRGDLGDQPIRFNIIHCADYDQVDIEIKRFWDKETDYVYSQ
jgi:nucleoside-diphosphate kinase